MSPIHSAPSVTGEPSAVPVPPEHGGRLRLAAARCAIPLDDWLDLSTGINPLGWPVPPVPASAWSRLPEEDDGLETAAERYYGAIQPLPLCGSQAAIQALPRLRPPCRIGVPRVGYQEHAYAWRSAGHAVVELADGDPGALLEPGPERLDCLLVINPNNPTGRRWPVATLLDWHARLAGHGGWLLVDEAFMDATPESSLLPYIDRPGLLVLRSLGKFFGLAGARVGFLFAEPAVRESLRRLLGPWSLAGPARLIARQALEDTDWQLSARGALARSSERLADLLRAHGLAPSGGTRLFQWVETPLAEEIQSGLGRQGILVRRFDRPASLRFGLPGADPEWVRLARALAMLAGGRTAAATAGGAG